MISFSTYHARHLNFKLSCGDVCSYKLAHVLCRYSKPLEAFMHLKLLSMFLCFMELPLIIIVRWYWTIIFSPLWCKFHFLLQQTRRTKCLYRVIHKQNTYGTTDTDTIMVPYILKNFTFVVCENWEPKGFNVIFYDAYCDVQNNFDAERRIYLMGHSCDQALNLFVEFPLYIILLKLHVRVYVLCLWLSSRKIKVYFKKRIIQLIQNAVHGRNFDIIIIYVAHKKCLLCTCKIIYVAHKNCFVVHMQKCITNVTLNLFLFHW